MHNDTVIQNCMCISVKVFILYSSSQVLVEIVSLNLVYIRWLLLDVNNN